jgi:hypothetical protein
MGENIFTDPREIDFISSEIDRCLGTGAWVRATRLTHVSRAFCVPKPNGKYRLVIDLRPINVHVEPVKCRFETLRTMRRIARRNDWFLSFDLADGYHCIGIHPEDQHFMTFVLNGQAYSAAALPFGYNRSPYIFTKVMRTLVKYLRAPQHPTTGGMAHRIRRRGAPHRRAGRSEGGRSRP